MQEPTRTTNHNVWDAAADVCFPPNEPLLFKARILQKFHPIRICYELLAKQNHLGQKNVRLGDQLFFPLFLERVIWPFVFCQTFQPPEKAFPWFTGVFMTPPSQHVSSWGCFFHQDIFKYLQCLSGISTYRCAYRWVKHNQIVFVLLNQKLCPWR